MKSSPAAEPMRMFGGSPMRVAVPPMFEASTWLMRYGAAEIPSRRATDSVTGVMSRTVVTLSRNADSPAVTRHRMRSSRSGSPRDSRTEWTASHWKKPVLDERTGEDHHPGQQEDDIEVDGRERLLLVDDPEDDEQQATEQGDEGPVEAFRGDEGIGDQEDAACDPGVHQATTGERAVARSPIGVRSSRRERERRGQCVRSGWSSPCMHRRPRPRPPPPVTRAAGPSRPSSRRAA